MVRIEATYDGSLRCTATHMPSGTKVITDAPVDNMGKGESFSPTDLVATALITCVMTTVAIVAERNGYEVGAMRAEVEKGMVADPKRRIGSLPVTLHMPASLSDEARRKLETAAKHCPVHESLGERLEAPITFVYE